MSLFSLTYTTHTYQIRPCFASFNHTAMSLYNCPVCGFGTVTGLNSTLTLLNFSELIKNIRAVKRHRALRDNGNMTPTALSVTPTYSTPIQGTTLCALKVYNIYIDVYLTLKILTYSLIYIWFIWSFVCEK